MDAEWVWVPESLHVTVLVKVSVPELVAVGVGIGVMDFGLVSVCVVLNESEEEGVNDCVNVSDAVFSSSLRDAVTDSLSDEENESVNVILSENESVIVGEFLDSDREVDVVSVIDCDFELSTREYEIVSVVKSDDDSETLCSCDNDTVFDRVPESEKVSDALSDLESGG